MYFHSLVYDLERYCRRVSMSSFPQGSKNNNNHSLSDEFHSAKKHCLGTKNGYWPLLLKSNFRKPCLESFHNNQLISGSHDPAYFTIWFSNGEIVHCTRIDSMNLQLPCPDPADHPNLLEFCM